jgi:hypothetical protein
MCRKFVGDNTSTCCSWYDADAVRFGALDELNSYLDLGSPRSASTYSSSAVSNLERETPDVPWGVAGGLEASEDGLGLGEFLVQDIGYRMKGKGYRV